MSMRDQLLNAAKRAGEVLDNAEAKQRIKEGYTRIDPIAIAEGDGVPVMVRPLERLLGAFLRPQSSPGILVNSQRPIGMVHLTCAHELGHYFLGHDTKTDEDLEYDNSGLPDERAANEFAYRLLMPRWLVINIMNHKGWNLHDLEHADIVYQLSLRLGVSYTAMVWTLSRLKLLKEGVASSISRSSPKSLKKAASPTGVHTPQQGDVWVLDVRDKDFVIEPRTTDLFILKLPNHAGAGYIWTADAAANEGFKIKPVVVDVSALAKPMEPVVVGNEENMQYLLEPSDSVFHSKEVLPLLLSERQPWAGGALRDHFGLKARYEDISNGLSLGSRQRLVQEAAEG